MRLPAALQKSARRGTPYGSAARVRQTAADLNLLHTLGGAGRGSYEDGRQEVKF